jgi:hypothetical protein
MAFNIKIGVGGGYAYIFGASSKVFDVAPIKASLGAKEHRLTMVALDGEPMNGSLPMTNVGSNDKPIQGWNLRGKRVEVWPDGKKMSPGLTGPLPPHKTSFIPDVPGFVGGTLASDWPSLVRSRLTLRSGTLSVSLFDLSKGFFTFKNNKGGTKQARRLSGGIHGLHYEAMNVTAEFVEFAVFPVGTPDAQVDPNRTHESIFIKPSGASVVMSVNDREDHTPAPNDVLTEFAVFYDLLSTRIDADDMYIPTWSLNGGALGVSPGSECAAGGFDDQNG